MAQETNLNVSPYFDDFDAEKNFHKVLFKPGLPIQARELTTLQSILQNQVEQVGTHLFKEGSCVIPGQINYNNNLFAVEVEESFLGTNVLDYADNLINEIINGSNSGVKAKIIDFMEPEFSTRGYVTLFLSYLGSGINDKDVFDDNETLLLKENVVAEIAQITLQAGQGCAKTAPTNSTSVGSAVFISEGVYFIRGQFVRVEDETLILDPHDADPTCRVGLEITEEIVTSSKDQSLTDNAKGFNNFAAPGADRLKLSVRLGKRSLDSDKNENFVELMVINGGSVSHIDDKIKYNELGNELARRTYSHAGDFYVKPFTISAKESLNDNKGNNGVFGINQLTYGNSTPSPDLGTYKISPGKAFIKGFEVPVRNVVYLDFEKTRVKKVLKNQAVNYYTGPTLTVNRAYGCPRIGFTTTSSISLRDSRIGANAHVASGKEIGVARVYDYALESGSYSSALPATNEFDVTLYDIQPYTEITVNQAVTLTVPTFIKGKSSGSTAHLRFGTTTGIITAYNSSGSFSPGEKLIFNGVDDNRIATAITAHSIGAVESIHSAVGVGTFNADVKQFTKIAFGNVNITPKSGTAPGISTVTITGGGFRNRVKAGDLVSFTNPLLGNTSVKTIATVSSYVDDSNIIIAGVTTVAGVCDGGLPSSAAQPVDFEWIGSKFQSSTDNSLYTPLPKSWVADVDLTESNITIRKEYDVTITANATNTIQAGQNETFLAYDEERYVLTNDAGVTEELTPDKLRFTNGGRELRIFGLSATAGSARLVATLNKINIKNKVKNRIRTNSIIVNKSKLVTSGVGTTSLNDGLSYGNYGYGLRVQDTDICLGEPDVTKVYGVFESGGTADPLIPSITVFNMNGPTGRVDDLISGEEFVGKTTGAIGLYIERINSAKAAFVYLSDLRFELNEQIEFVESGIVATINDFDPGDNNIMERFSLDSGQRETICDYARLIRKPNSKDPRKKLRVIFESAEYASTDDGDITTVSSYDQIDYCVLPDVREGTRLSDIIDIRPRVTNFDLNSTAVSPFEFNARVFSDATNSAKNILASDESINIQYSYYQPRIDRIYLTKNGQFQLIKGIPADTPVPPIPVEDALEVALCKLPPYICNTENIEVLLKSHKRYRMQDIALLEDRIQNLEYYTALSLLESNTESLFIPDNAGLTRFKSGIYVDNFSGTATQLKLGKVTNSVDPSNLELRPTHYTTEVDLLLGSRSLIGIGTTASATADPRFVTDLIGNGIKRTGQLLTLDYDSAPRIVQGFATRVENVTPYLVTTYTGNIVLFPSSDIWIDQVRLQPQRIEVDNYTQTRRQLEFDGYDPQTGLGPVRWGTWNTTWTGSSSTSSSNRIQTGSNSRNNGSQIVTTNSFQTTTTTTTTRTGTSTRAGERLRISEVTDTVNEGDKVVSTSVIAFMRSRNIEFTGRKFKPLTRLYGFFDGQDVNAFVVPKLIEVKMISGTFTVGQLVNGTMAAGTVTATNAATPRVSFRVATSNHKIGPIASPTDVFTTSPYDESYTVPATYSSSSILVNVDTVSLADQTQGLYSGFIRTGMRLRSATGEAEITNIRLFSDHVGTVLGSFFIPNPNITSNPSFEVGTKLFRLTSNSTNSTIGGMTGTFGEESYFAQGTINNMQETIRSTRRPRFDVQAASETRPATDVTSTQSVSTSSETSRVPLPPPPPPPPPPPSPPPRPTPTVPPRPRPTPRPRPVPRPRPTPPPPPPPPRPTPPPRPRPPRRPARGGKDPLAQSFSVQNESGIFVTEVDIFFRTKDPLLPVTVQLRPMVAGVPSEEVYPFGEAILEAKDIFESADAGTPTTVTFPSPVYLEPKTDHSIVLLSQSNEYTVWISRMGEVDITTLLQPESRQVVVSAQPSLGSLFKSQNGSTWNPSQYEDLKFSLYSADFFQPSGTISFYNPELARGNNQIATLVKDSLEFNSKKLIVTTDDLVNTSGLVLGNTIIQKNANASANYVGAGGSATGDLSIINAGIGYTPTNGSQFTFTGVSLDSFSGIGKNATADITVGTSGGINGVAIAATINAGGSGYQVGDVLTIPTIGNDQLGRNMQLSLGAVTGINELILDDIQGDFEISSTKPLQYVSPSTGITTMVSVGFGSDVNISDYALSTLEEDGMHIKVNHKNHGMHQDTNKVIVSDVQSDTKITTLSAEYSNSSSSAIGIANTAGFESFENVGVAATNPGYVRVNDEIISYTGIAAGQLTGITRSIDQTTPFTYPSKTPVEKYEVNGISLRRINKTHDLQDATPARSITLDSYFIKINPSLDGTDRSTGIGFPKLFINESKSAGGEEMHATQNIQFEAIRPVVQTMVLPDTNIKAEMKNTTATSIDGIEQSFVETESTPINIDEDTYLDAPRMIASRVNELERLDSRPGNKSMEVTFTLSSSDTDISPVIDLDRVGMVLISNRVNAPITDYAGDSRASTIVEDPTSFIYANKPITLENSATSIKVLMAAYTNTSSDLRCFYSISNDLESDPIYYPFPGYDNLDVNGAIKDIAKNSGLPDKRIPKTDVLAHGSDDLPFTDYEFSIDDLPEFRYFSIKIVGTGTDQAYPPRIRDLRAIALA